MTVRRIRKLLRLPDGGHAQALEAQRGHRRSKKRKQDERVMKLVRERKARDAKGS